ncbi:Short stature homeobox protein 2, partial [Coemansia erecta]
MLLESPLFVDKLSASLPITNHNPMFSAQADTAPHTADPMMAASIDAGLGAAAAAPAKSESPAAAAAAASAKEAASASGARSSAKLGHRKRARATSEQVNVLESVFLVNRSPASRMREDLATRLGMAPRQVQVWFQNRRAKEKSQQKNPRGMQNPVAAFFDPMALANVNPDVYSMAMATSLMPVGPDPGAGAGANGFLGNPALPGFGFAAPPPGHIGHAIPQHQQAGHLFENQMALAAAATAPGGVNPWLNWSIDMARQTQMLPSPGHSGGVGLPPHALHMPLQGAAAPAPQAADSTSKADFGLTAATAAACVPLYAANICDSRRESEMSGITAVASPIGLGPAASESAATTASSAASPATTPAAATALAVATPDSGSASVAIATPGPTFSALADTANTTMAADLATLPPCAVSTGEAPWPQRAASAASVARRPAPLALGPHQVAGSGAAAGVGPRMALGYPGLIPEFPSYMVLDATRLMVGAWQRVSKPDTELVCLACVEPPPPKPVQRPGNHRPAELDYLVGEFQWIISSCGVRYKMVLPYSTISRITFRETPDPAAGLVDPALDSVLNPQAALAMLGQALKNPQARGELAIHVYDTPLFFFQAEGGEWREIGDFSEDSSATSSKVHTISGAFVTLFCQLRVLLATCSRLKVAADPLMTLWLGNMDDPYSAMTVPPHNSWMPCAGAVCLHSAQRGGAAAGAGADGAGDEASVACIPVSAAASSACTLTPTPTSTAFTFGDAPLPYHGTLAAAIASGGVGQSASAVKTQRSASLPFIRPMPGAAKAGSSSLSRTVTGDDGAVGLGISNTPPPSAAQPLRHRTSCNHLRRQAPYAVGQPAASPRVNSPQMSPLPHWCTGGIRRASRDSLVPPGAFARRESDVELALAMNSAFANGDVLGTHRSLGELCGGAAVPPSPLSNIAISAMQSSSASAPAMQNGADAIPGPPVAMQPNHLSGSAMQTDSFSASAMQTNPLLASAMQADSVSALAMQADSASALTMHNEAAPAAQPDPADSFLLPPNDAYGPASKAGATIAGLEGPGMFNANMMLAIFNAMTATPDSSGIPALPAVSAPAGVVDPAALAFDPNTKGAADMWADWAQAASAQGLLPGLLAPGDGDDMNIDWPRNDADARR